TKKRDPIRYSIGFFFRPSTRNARPTMLVGTWQEELWHKVKFTVLEPEHASAQDIASWVKAANRGDPLGLAIQFKMRGWEQLAQALFQKASHNERHEPPRSTLGKSAWNYWIEQLRESDTDWPAITRQLKILLASDPRLDSAANRSLLNSLDATLVPGKAKPGSIEAMIDDLVQVRKNLAPFQCTVTDPKQLRVLQLGFDAVPHLIEHLDDQRLTLSGDTVGRLAAEMVQGLAGSQFSKDLDDPEHDWTAWKADAR